MRLWLRFLLRRGREMIYVPMVLVYGLVVVAWVAVVVQAVVLRRRRK